MRNDDHFTNRAAANSHGGQGSAAITSADPLAKRTGLVGTNICVIGGGFVGLVAAAGFAQFGHNVVCVERNPEYLAMLQQGRVPFYERDLDGLIRTHLQTGRLSFLGDLAEGVNDTQAIFIAVGTPSDPSGRAELSAIDEVARGLAASVRPGQVVVIKSTVPVGTGSRLQAQLNERYGADGAISVVNNPEFLREGSAVWDFFNPQRIVIGSRSQEAIRVVSDIYRLGMMRTVNIITANNETAELIKYASNAFLATKIGFINEMALICDRAGINVLEVARAMGQDSRIGSEFLEPGPGWGGSCFRKDLQEFTGFARSQGASLAIAEAVLTANQKQFAAVVTKVISLTGDLAGRRVAVLGLAFKANTSDMRDSAALPIVRELLARGATVCAYDPEAHIEATNWIPDIELAESAYAAAAGADCLLIITEWAEFQSLDLGRLADTMAQRNIVDARNIIAPETAHRYGFQYVGMGQS
ncbi:MAG: UDP-glucose/GDP-mannose dehydrogenase family protein [Candidatus Zixiibacteriota bacterium]